MEEYYIYHVYVDIEGYGLNAVYVAKSDEEIKTNLKDIEILEIKQIGDSHLHGFQSIAFESL